MMEPSYKKIHPAFKLNGFHFTKQALQEVGYSLIKEGESHERAIGDFLLDWLDERPTVDVRTSGSTGIPRRITLRKEQMANSALATGEFFELGPGDSTLLCLPSDFIAGKMMWVRALVLGLELDYVVPSSNPLSFVSSPYDFCAMVPMQLENSLKRLDSIKTLIVGGAPVKQALKEKVWNCKTVVFETYGMTETVSHIAVKRIAPCLDQNFRTLPDVRLSKDERNCLVIDAPKISDHTVATNDLVKLVSESEFQWLGRLDNIINSGGVKLFPEQIEVKLGKIISGRFFVAGLPDERLGEKLALIIEGDNDTGKLLQKIKALRTLDRFEVPKEIYALKRFKETENGKIRRKESLDTLKV